MNVNPIAPSERYGPKRSVLVFTKVGPGVVHLDNPLPGVLILERPVRVLPRPVLPTLDVSVAVPLRARIRYQRMRFAGRLQDLDDWEEWGEVHHDPRTREDWLDVPVYVQDGVL